MLEGTRNFGALTMWNKNVFIAMNRRLKCLLKCGIFLESSYIYYMLLPNIVIISFPPLVLEV